jgi:ACS family glucarate transporter-like MFS transporter
MPDRRPLIPIRWRIFAFMFMIGFVAYLQQKTLTIAAEPMEPALALSQFQIGLLRGSFILGYALCQFPAGLIGERLGARRTFVYAGTLAIIAMLAMPIAPHMLRGDALFIAMLLAQALLGVAQSVVWPVSAGVIGRWFPSSQWAFVIGLQTMSLSLASALTPPLISHLMVSHGWQRAFVYATLPAIPLVLLWAWYGRNTPREHPSVTAAELAMLDPVATQDIGGARAGSLYARVTGLLSNRNVLLLAFSYLCMNYVFYLVGDWPFLYLAQERHLSIPDSGWWAMLPPFGAAIGAAVGGAVTTALCRKFGPRWGLRALPLVALPAAGLLLLCTIWSSSPYLAVFWLTACFAAIEMNESAYWAATMNAGGGETMASTGILNTGGNVGGLVTAPIVGFLSGQHHWNATFFIGAAFAAVSAATWLFVDGAPAAAGQAREPAA